MTMLTGILIGALGLLVLAAFGFLLYFLAVANRNLERAVEVFGKSAEMATALTAQVAVSRRMVTSVEQMVAVMKVFNGLMLRDGGAAPAAAVEPYVAPYTATPRRESMMGRTPPPPPVPAWDEYAPEGEAVVLTQSDEDMALEEARQEARAIGIETDPELTPMPPASQVNYFES